jgi:ABC-type multidrug transport system ATPase subunit
MPRRIAVYGGTFDPLHEGHLRVAAGIVEAFDLGGHLDKELFRLSTGSRRKLALVAAFAGGSTVVLLDAPFAGLDRASREVLGDCLADAAGHRSRAWVLADHERPPALDGLALAAELDLGD